jgi:hypothetical protein
LRLFIYTKDDGYSATKLEVSFNHAVTDRTSGFDRQVHKKIATEEVQTSADKRLNAKT